MPEIQLQPEAVATFQMLSIHLWLVALRLNSTVENMHWSVTQRAPTDYSFSKIETIFSANKNG